MSTYDDEMYQFIAAKDNFEVAAEIYNLFPKVKERIATEFWETVKEKIIELDTEKKWIIDIFGNEIFIYKYGWEACVAATNTDKSVSYGIWFNHELYKKKLNDEEDGRAILAENEAVYWMDKGKAWWFFIHGTEDNFQEHSTLKKATIENRESLVNEWAECLYNLANNTEKDLEKINQKRT